MSMYACVCVVMPMNENGKAHSVMDFYVSAVAAVISYAILFYYY